MTVWLRTRGLLSDRRSWDVVAVSRPSGSGVLFLPGLPEQSQSVGEWCFMFQCLPHL